LQTAATTTLSDINSAYIELVSKEKNEPVWFTESRRKAFSSFLSLPLEVSPLYSKYSDANRIRPQNVRFSRLATASQLNEYLAGRLKEIRQGAGILQVGSDTAEVSIQPELSSKGVIVTTLNKAILEHPEIVKRCLDRNPLNTSEDKYLALEASSFQSGAFIYVPKGVAVEDPIRIVTSFGADGTSLVCRNMIVAEAGAKASIVQELYSDEAKSESYQHGYFELIEAHLAPNANIEMVTLQAMDPNSINVSNRKAFVERDARMSWYVGMFGSLLSRCKTDSIMKEAGASAEDVEIIFGDARQSFDIMSNLVHLGQHTRGRVLAKSVLKDNSKSLFKGMIKISKDGKGSEAYLAGHAILLDRGAKSDAIPGLEIETNEVKATHSASVAQMDENQIYYLCTRGLSREGAKREIVSGFLEPLSRKMGPIVRAWVNYLIENKWLGRPLTLKSDEVMAQILEVEKSRYRETQDLFEKHYKYR
jgi:FeS assembly protein SufD